MLFEELVKIFILWRWRGFKIFFDKKWCLVFLVVVWGVYVKLFFFIIIFNEYNLWVNKVGFVFKKCYFEGLFYSIKKGLIWYIYYMNID